MSERKSDEWDEQARELITNTLAALRVSERVAEELVAQYLRVAHSKGRVDGSQSLAATLGFTKDGRTS